MAGLVEAQVASKALRLWLASKSLVADVSIRTLADGALGVRVLTRDGAVPAGMPAAAELGLPVEVAVAPRVGGRTILDAIEAAATIERWLLAAGHEALAAPVRTRNGFVVGLYCLDRAAEDRWLKEGPSWLHQLPSVPVMVATRQYWLPTVSREIPTPLASFRNVSGMLLDDFAAHPEQALALMRSNGHALVLREGSELTLIAPEDGGEPLVATPEGLAADPFVVLERARAQGGAGAISGTTTGDVWLTLITDQKKIGLYLMGRDLTMIERREQAGARPGIPASEVLRRMRAEDRAERRRWVREVLAMPPADGVREVLRRVVLESRELPAVARAEARMLPLVVRGAADEIHARVSPQYRRRRDARIAERIAELTAPREQRRGPADPGQSL